jgi:hypothetical protein
MMSKEQERPAVRTTIVGGRPPGSGKEIGPVPTGIDNVIQTAAKDMAFASMLLGEEMTRKDAIARMGLTVSEVELKMLESVDREQLRTIIRAARAAVPPREEISQADIEKRTSLSRPDVRTRGIRPDRPF